MCLVTGFGFAAHLLVSRQMFLDSKFVSTPIADVRLNPKVHRVDVVQLEGICRGRSVVAVRTRVITDLLVRIFDVTD